MLGLFFTKRKVSGFRWRQLLLVSFCGLWSLAAMSSRSDSGTIGGVIRDEDGRPLRGAAVTLSGAPAGSTALHSTSSSSGEYQFSGLAPGEYTLGAELSGYAAASTRVIQITAESNAVSIDLVLVRNSKKGGATAALISWGAANPCGRSTLTPL